MAPTISPKIAIIGAGPASLTLANILQNHSIPFTIYESADSIRNQGGTLDLHPAGGQLALKEAGLWDEFVKHARPESDVLKLVDVSTGEVLWDENTFDKQEVKEEEKFDGRPEIDRAKLMELLIKNLNPASVRFSRKLQKLVPGASENKYDVHFADNTTETGFDLVVGADGAWSKVRDLLTDVKPEYSGISSIEQSVFNAQKDHPYVLEYTGAGSMFAFGQDRAVQAQRVGDGSIRTYASFRAPEDYIRTCGINWENQDEARKEYVKRHFSDAGAHVRRLVLETTDSLIPRTLYQLPVGFTWQNKPGVTLIGDAAHLMTPFAGVGVNAAMLDSFELAKGIKAVVDGEKTLDEAIKSYEEAMFPRGAKFAQKTQRNMKMLFSAGGAQQMARMLRDHHYGPGK